MHVVWATKYEQYYYKTYYNLLYLSGQWMGMQTVTSGTGGRPSIATSENKAHISYNVYSTEIIGYPSGSPAYTRDYNFITNQWEEPIYINTNPPPLPGTQVHEHSTLKEKLMSRNNLLHAIVYEQVWLEPEEGGSRQLHVYVIHKKRGVNSTTWEQENTVTKYVNYFPENCVLTPSYTINGNIHISYFHEYWTLVSNFYNGTSWSGSHQISFPEINPIKSFSLSSCLNDLYALWIINENNYLQFNKANFTPLTPSNFSLTNTGYPNWHPYLTWNLVDDPDVRDYEEGICIERSLYNAERQVWGNWETFFRPGTDVSFTDVDIYNAAGAGPGYVRYRIRSKDRGGLYSPYTENLSVRYGTSPQKEGHEIEQIFAYSLNQNYPNPFNPSTVITFSLQQEAKVSLKVYNILGREIANLLDEVKQAGIHTIPFYASNLNSGIYIYRITVQNGEKILFTESKQMIFIK